eukprot:7331184-Karenia_brevis.AAC.1
MGHSTYDEKVAYLKQQLKQSSIKADQFRSYWKNHCGGTITKRGSYITRPDVIDMIAHRIITQHGSYGQDIARDKRQGYDCPYMWSTGVDVCYRYTVYGNGE